MKKRQPEKAGPTKPSQFRLESGALAEIDLIAAYHAEQTGMKVTRTDAVRIAAKREADRIRRLKEGGK